MDNQQSQPFNVDRLWYSKHWLTEPAVKMPRRKMLNGSVRSALIGLIVAAISGGAALRYFGSPF